MLSFSAPKRGRPPKVASNATAAYKKQQRDRAVKQRLQSERMRNVRTMLDDRRQRMGETREDDGGDDGRFSPRYFATPPPPSPHFNK